MCVDNKSQPSFHFQNSLFLKMFYFGVYSIVDYTELSSPSPSFSHLEKTIVSTVCKLVGVAYGKEMRRTTSTKRIRHLIFLQSHPEVYKLFSDARCITFVEKLQEGYHQAIVYIFAKSYDGKKATVGSLELIADEATIASTTSLPRIGQI
jgi:hypothetical protein